MDGRERITRIIAGETPDRPSFWLGNPHGETVPIYLDAFKQKSVDDLRTALGDDFRWVCPQWNSYKHPEGKPHFDMQSKAKTLSAPGVFSECEDVQEVEDFPWPNPDYLDFTESLAILKNYKTEYRATSFWGCFFHDLCDFFGMENYFIKMFTDPDVVKAVTRHVMDYYLEANRRYFEVAGKMIDGVFYGNDFGTQLDLLIGPDQFREFVLPYFKELTDQGHEHGYQVILHSCGAINRVIPDLIDIGVDAIHPLQAKAADMDAESLGARYKGKVAFIGGIDTQDLLVNGTPEEVAADVRRVKEHLGPNLVISPSHEALLPNVPPKNVEAMAKAALE